MFQKIIINKHIENYKNANKEKLDNLYNEYSKHFLDETTQENIRTSKEEQYQEGFLRDLFVKILGYTINPEPNYNLITEQKNVQDSKKADGSIIIDNEIVAVIELKGSNTKDLASIDAQAFNYKASHKNCQFVITSNFEKLRFYIDNLTEHEEFNLFTLNKEEFIRLHLLLSFESIKNKTALKIKELSISEENAITTKLYKDYSAFKKDLFNDLILNNPEIEKLKLFKMSQTLLDRLLFIFFAEDKGLLPANTIKSHINSWETAMADPLNPRQKLYDRFKIYFSLLNTGHKEADIFAYNGGLFKENEELNSLIISDEVLKNHTLKLSAYDFATEVDVNILGHIFENSLTEIEEVTNEIVTGETPVSKRKKDGVFYTPRYITKYIVDNTVGKLCTEKKEELGIKEDDYSFKLKRNKATINKLREKLDTYRNWLLGITICDPACGSGAFLNTSLDFLIDEHKLIDEMSANIDNSFAFPNVENSILENNLFGVDINEESIEIAKLSLWLRTAKPKRKLNSLSSNIKCGNSLISDKTIDSQKAFNWQEEFPKVFANGGFDVIIGNPPYVFARENFSKEEKLYFSNNYTSAKYQVNTYMLFMEKSIEVLKDYGIWGLIIPNSWLMIYSAEELRRYMLNACSFSSIVNLIGKSFDDASVETVITIARKEQLDTNEIEIFKTNDDIKAFEFLHNKTQLALTNNPSLEFNIFADDLSTSIIDKLKTDSFELDYLCSVKAGLQAYEKGKGTPKQTAEDVKNRPYDYDYKYNEDTHRYLDGSNVGRYNISWSGLWLYYGIHLAAPRTFDLFDGEKIIVREITGKYPHCLISTYSNDLYLYNRSNIAIINRDEFDISLKYVNAILNSSTISYYFSKNTAKAERKLFPKIILNDLRKFPIKNISKEEQAPFIELADKMISLNEDLSKKANRFLKRLNDSFEAIKINTALEKFYDLSFKDLLAQLKKQKISLTLKQQDEWEDYFNDYKSDCSNLLAQINNTDDTINSLVYQLYGLTDEEIGLVEGK